MSGKRLMNTREACRHLGVSRMTLLKAEQLGLLSPFRTAGGHRRYAPDELERYLTATRRSAAQRDAFQPAAHDALLPRLMEQVERQRATLQEMLSEAIRHLVLFLQADSGFIFLLNREGTLKLQAAFGAPHWVVRKVQQLAAGAGGPSRRAMLTRQPAVYVEGEGDLPVDLGEGQGVCVPLTYRNETLGVLHVLSVHRHQFFPSEIGVLSTVAIYLASLIVNERLAARYRQRVEELAALDLLACSARSAAELDRVLDTLVEKTVRLVHADAGAVLLREGDAFAIRAQKGLPEASRTLRIAVREGISGKVAEEGRPYFSGDLSRDPACPPQARAVTAGLTSDLCLPLRVESEVIGVLHVATRRQRAFTENEEMFLAIAAGQAASAVRRIQHAEQVAHFCRLYERQADPNVTPGGEPPGAPRSAAAWPPAG